MVSRYGGGACVSGWKKHNHIFFWFVKRIFFKLCSKTLKLEEIIIAQAENSGGISNQASQEKTSEWSVEEISLEISVIIFLCFGASLF